MKKLILISTLLIGCLTTNIPPKNAEKIYDEVIVAWTDENGTNKEIIMFNTSIRFAEQKFREEYGYEYFALICIGQEIKQ